MSPISAVPRHGGLADGVRAGPPIRPPTPVFLRSVRAGIIVYVIAIAILASGPGQLFALGAIACGLLVGVLAGLVRWLRGCNFRDALALGAVVACSARDSGLGDPGDDRQLTHMRGVRRVAGYPGSCTALPRCLYHPVPSGEWFRVSAETVAPDRSPRPISCASGVALAAIAAARWATASVIA